ncbi:hypothetical protein K432DRAFT_299476, partial [Lepidopterella palustris CBS 459.81]
VRCSVHIAALKDQPEYGALSYAWDSPSPELFQCGMTAERKWPIFCNEKQLFVAENLSILWIDAVCNNQNDMAEHGHQINLMADIFHSARRVTVWIGQEYDDAEPAYQPLNAWTDFQGNS